MSFRSGLRSGLDTITEALVLVLMLVFFVAVMFSNIEFSYKIIITILSLSIIFLVTALNQYINQK